MATSKIKRYDFEKIIDDLKITAKATKVMADENDQEKRHYAHSLVKDLFDRLYRDMEEMRDTKEKNGRTYGGNLKKEKQ